jgi:ribonuclease HI
MELMGVITGFEALTKPCEVTVVSDSKYVTDAFNQKWIESWVRNNWRTAGKKEVKNIDLWKRLLEAVKPHQFTFVWVKGHAGHPENERCDELATKAADGDNLLDDEIGAMIE